MAKEYQKRKCHCICRHKPQCQTCVSGVHRSGRGWHEEFECSGPAKTPWNNPEFDSFTLRHDAPPGKTRPEPNMPTLNELVDIGIGRQVHKALADSNNAADFDRWMRSLLPRMITESLSVGRGWFHDQYIQTHDRYIQDIQAKGNKPVEPQPPEVPTYPAAQPRKMRIKP